MGERVPIKYDYRDLALVSIPFSGEAIVDPGSVEVRLDSEILFFSEDFRINTQSDELGTTLILDSDYQFVQKNSRMTTQWGKDVYEAIQIINPTYEPGTIYAFGDIAGSVVGSDDSNRFQEQIDELKQGTAMADVGQLLYFSEQKSRTSLLEFELDNAISQSTYSVLFAEIGHKYNDLHVLAGDADLSGSGTLFYPTPPPTENGYLAVYEDWSNTTNTVTLAQADGRYKVTYVNGGSTGNQYTAELTLDSVGGVTTPIVINGSLNLDARVQYTYATGIWSCVAEATFDIVKIEKLVPETLSVDGHYGYIKSESITPSGEAVSDLRFDTGWIANSDWADFNPTINHALGSDLSNLETHIFLSSDGMEANAIEVQTIFRTSTVGGQVYGHQFEQVDENNIALQTGLDGVMYFDSSGDRVLLGGASPFYYKVVVTKPNLITTYIEPLRTVYDISDSVDIPFNLPDASTVTREYTIKRRGAGTGKVLFTTQSSQTIEGLTTSIWELEGEGEIVLFPSGGNWEVKHYEDSGNNSDGIWQKLKNGELYEYGILTITGASTTGDFPLAFVSTPSYTFKGTRTSGASTSNQMSTIGATSTTQYSMIARNVEAETTETAGDWSWEMRGRWRI